MAVLQFTNNKIRVVPHEVALQVWQVMNGEVEPTAEQEAFMMTIKRVYLNRHRAPASYLKAHLSIIDELDRLSAPVVIGSKRHSGLGGK